MNFQFFSILSAKLSFAWQNTQKFFIYEDIKASKNPLYLSFNLYAKEDLKLALDLCKNGYAPTNTQLKNLHESLLKEASNNTNFLFKFQIYKDMIPEQAIINYCLSHDLSDKCKNEKTVYNNFKELLAYFSQKEYFSENLYSQLKTSIFNTSIKLSSIKPKYSSIHAFELNNKEHELNARFRANIYNCLVLIKDNIKSMDQFVSLRTTIEQSVEKIENNLQKHNVRIVNYDNEVVHYNKHNHGVFSTELLRDWIGFIQKYDTKSLEQALIEKIKKPTATTENNKTTVVSVHNNTYNELEGKINSVKSQLNSENQEQINRITSLYKTIVNDMFEKKQHHELDSLYKDLPNVIEKFISIHPDYRTTLRNVEGKNPEELMIESLTVIENKFKIYLEEINQDKLTDLSIVGRTIKMKA